MKLSTFKNYLGWGEQQEIATECKVTLRTVNKALNDRVERPNQKVMQAILKRVEHRQKLEGLLLNS